MCLCSLNRRCLLKIWEIFPDVDQRVRQSHVDALLSGHHDIWHARRVGQIAYLAAAGEWGDERLSQLAGLAGLCHNADRVIQRQTGAGRKDVPKEAVVELIKHWLIGATDFLEEGQLGGYDRELIEKAILGHDGPNSDEDSKVLVALMDGDRVVNLDIDLFIRAGQFYNDLPAVDYKHLLEDLEETYRNPKSVLRDCYYALEWATPGTKFCVRTKRGRYWAGQRAAKFVLFFEILEEQLKQEGVHPYKFKD